MSASLPLARRCIFSATFFLAAAAAMVPVHAATPPAEKIVIDSDIGDDIDDAFALGVALQSPQLDILGMTTAWGDTRLRAQLLERMLRESGHADIPVAVGIATHSETPFTQARYAGRGQAPSANAPDAVSFLLKQIAAYPGQVTLVALGPLTNIGAAIARDPATFRKLKRVIMMGGSVRAGYRKSEYVAPRPADKEYNIVSDIPAAQALFRSGVPIVMMPLDATQIRLDEVERTAVLGHGSPVTDAVTLLYHQWIDSYQPWSSTTPTLFDVVPVIYAFDARVCKAIPMHIDIGDDGFTKEGKGTANAAVCLDTDKAAFNKVLMDSLLR